MLKLKKAILLFWSLTLLAFPLSSFAEEVEQKEMEKVDINTADMDTLADKLYGVGPVKAEAIVKYREEHGPFKAVIELTQVHGIGEGTLEKNKDILTVSVPQNKATEDTADQTTAEPTSKAVEKVTSTVEKETTTTEEKAATIEQAVQKAPAEEGQSSAEKKPEADENKPVTKQDETLENSTIEQDNPPASTTQN